MGSANSRLERQIYDRPIEQTKPETLVYEYYKKELKLGIIKNATLIGHIRSYNRGEIKYTKFYKVTNQSDIFWAIIECIVLPNCKMKTFADLDKTFDNILHNAYISDNEQEITDYFSLKVKNTKLQKQINKSKRKQERIGYFYTV
jgi:hypothetical protein